MDTTSQATLIHPTWTSQAAAAFTADSTSPVTSQQAPAVDNFFDYAGFMWDNPEWWQQYQTIDASLATTQVDNTMSDLFSSPNTNSPALTATEETRRLEYSHPHHPAAASASASQQAQSERAGNMVQDTQAGDHLLLDSFLHSTVPPILAPVETRQQWSSMRRHFLVMAQESPMVRLALLSFSDLLLHRRQNSTMSPDGQRYHQDSSRELASSVTGAGTAVTKREHLLATCFFLSYVDILGGRTEAAHGSLKAAYTIFDQGDKMRQKS